MYFSIFHFSFTSFYFTYFVALLFDAFTFKITVSSWWFRPIIFTCPSLLLIIFFALKFTLSDIKSHFHMEVSTCMWSSLRPLRGWPHYIYAIVKIPISCDHSSECCRVASLEPHKDSSLGSPSAFAGMGEGEITISSRVLTGVGWLFSTSSLLLNSTFPGRLDRESRLLVCIFSILFFDLHILAFLGYCLLKLQF